MLLLFLLASLRLVSLQSIDSDDEEALLALFEETGGPGWKRPFNLDSLCASNGVTCEGSRVVELDLQDNNLIGKLPSKLEDLTTLEYLDLSSNILYGELPEEIVKISTLTHLYLAGNYFDCPIPIYSQVDNGDFDETYHCDSCEGVNSPCDCTKYHCSEDWGWSKSDGCMDDASTSEDELLDGGCQNCRDQPLCECTPEHCDVGWGWSGNVQGGSCEFGKTTTAKELIEGGCIEPAGPCINEDVCGCLPELCGDDWGWDYDRSSCMPGAKTSHEELFDGNCDGCFDESICDCTEDAGCPPNWGWAGDLDTGRCEYDKKSSEQELAEAGCIPFPETSESDTTSPPTIGRCTGVSACECTEHLCGKDWGWAFDEGGCVTGASTSEKELFDNQCPTCSEKLTCECLDELQGGDCAVGWGWSGDADSGQCEWGASTSEQELIEGNCIADPEVCGNCAQAHGGRGCEDPDIEECVCIDDDFCCEGLYDALCTNYAYQCGCKFENRPPSRCANPSTTVCECTVPQCGENWGWSGTENRCVFGGATKQSELVRGGCEHCADVPNACNCTEDAGCPPGWGWDDGNKKCVYGKSTSEAELVAGGCQPPAECLNTEPGRWTAVGGLAPLAQTRSDTSEECCRRCFNYDDCLWSWDSVSKRCILNKGDANPDDRSVTWVREVQSDLL